MHTTKEYILGIDQGGTGSKVVIMNREGAVICSAYRRIGCYFPQAGYVENDPDEVWESVRDSLIEVSQSFDLSLIRAIGITNQRETFLLWDRATGKPVTPAISYLCNRGSEIFAGWASFYDEIQQTTGMEPQGYYSASKLSWVLQNDPTLLQQAENGELCFGNINTWLLYKLTAGKSHLTDSTNAGTTMFFDMHKDCYDKSLMEKMGIPEAILPQVMPCDSEFGFAVEPAEAFTEPVPICGMLGDQMSALFGQTCFSRGEVKCTIGTATNLTVFTDRLEEPKLGFITGIETNLGGELTYEIEGGTFGSSTNEWLIEQLNLAGSPQEIGALAQEVDGTHGVCFVPAFDGIGTPRWSSDARALIIGLSRFHDKRHICRASLEAIALQVNSILNSLTLAYDIKVDTLRVDGGATKSDFIMQLLADYTQCKIVRPVNTECTATGAIYVAGLSCGLWKDKDELRTLWKASTEFTPKMDIKARDAAILYWDEAVKRCFDWASIGSERNKQ